MSSAVKGVVRLRVLAGKASPSPAIGQALGPLGVNMMEFCKSFNDRTKSIVEGTPIPVRLTAMNDRSFTYETKTPPASWFLKKAAGIDKGAKQPGQQTVAQLSMKHLYEIAKVKLEDEHMKHISVESYCKSLIGTAHSMGIKVVDLQK